MELRWLYFSARGRLSAKAFRQTYLGLFVVSVLSSLMPLIGVIFGLLTSIAMINITTKRLHDMGRSGWLQLAQIAPWAGVVAWAALAAAGEAKADEAIVRMAQNNALFLGALALATAISLGFLAWVALGAGQDGANAYGEHSISIVR